jgi:hypothetical protein
MWKLTPLPLAFFLVAFQLAAQPPGDRQAKDNSESSIVKKMMAFNTSQDGKLTKEQVTDPRLHRLFDLADANKDGIVTREELMALAAKMDAEFGQGGAGGKGKGPGGKGEKGFGGAKGKGGPGDGDGFPGGGPGGGLPGGGLGGFGGPPQPGQILPPFLLGQLKLTEEQKSQVEQLQKQVNAKLAEILTDKQKQMLKDMRPMGPGGFGPARGGQGGPGGPGFGPPPGGFPGGGPPPVKKDQ